VGHLLASLPVAFYDDPGRGVDRAGLVARAPRGQLENFAARTGDLFCISAATWVISQEEAEDLTQVFSRPLLEPRNF